jgi:hypothetical protein
LYKAILPVSPSWRREGKAGKSKNGGDHEQGIQSPWISL